MTNDILLDGSPLPFTEAFLPCLVAGAGGFGATYFSISAIANLIVQGSKIIYFTAFPMAKEELIAQIGTSMAYEVHEDSDFQHLPSDRSLIIPSGNRRVWETVLASLPDLDDYVIFVKNFEEYDGSLLTLLHGHEKIFLSGNLDACMFAQELLDMHWQSKIFFSSTPADPHVKLPILEKHTGYLISDDVKGIVSIARKS